MPNSGVRRYAAALQSLVSAGARDRLARAEEPVVRRLCAGGNRIRTIGPAVEETPFPTPDVSFRANGSDLRHSQQRLFKAALDELAVIGEPVNRVLEVDLDGEEMTLTLYDLPPA